jgi:predicted Zn-dependent protease
MKIIHESLPEEASQIAKSLKEILGLESELMEADLGEAFVPIPGFDGYWSSALELVEFLNLAEGKVALVLTPRDIYSNNKSKDDDWGFGYTWGKLTVVSSARLKRYDDKPSKELQVPPELYLKRLKALSIHEIGHKITHADHFQKAVWVNAKTGYEMDLGFHCNDNTCVMYEIVDIRAPPETEGYLRLGQERRYDAGLDDLLERINPNWFCDRCRRSIRIDEKYF